MTQVSTTPEQSKRLLDCGVDPKTSDMCYIGHHLDSIPYEGMLAQWMGDSAMKGRNRKAEDFDLSPAWSLSALLALLPKDLMWQGLYYRLVMGPNEMGWEIEYNDLSVINNLHRVKADNLIEATVQMVEYLTQNGYKLNEI